MCKFYDTFANTFLLLIFRILFTTSLHEGEFTRINLKMIESSTMELILQYIYMRQIDINYNNVLDIMRVADYLCIDGLVQLCQEFAVECLGPENCVTLMQFAEYAFKILLYIKPIGPDTFLIEKLSYLVESKDFNNNLYRSY